MTGRGEGEERSTPPDSEESVDLRSYRDGDDAGIFEVLASCQPDPWGLASVDHWRWKHRRRPAFEAPDVIVGTAGERIVACFHSAPMPLRVEPGLDVLASFDGDFAVLPSYRGRNITDRAYEISDRRLLRRGVAVRGGFTSPSLNEGFYRPRFGYLFIPTTGTSYRKILSFEALQRKVAELGQRASGSPLPDRLQRRSLRVSLHVEGFPPSTLRLEPEGLSLEEGPPPDPDLILHLPYAVLVGWAEGSGRFAARAAGALLTGRLRVGRILRFARRLVAAGPKP